MLEILMLGSLVFISVPPKPALRLKFKKKEGTIVIPQTCVLTGEPATELHTLRRFTILIPYDFKMVQMALPFSESGWKRYTKAYPLSLHLFKGGLNVLIRVPLFGAFLAIFVWTPLFGFWAGLISLVELFLHRRQLVAPLGISMKDDGVTAIDIVGVNEKFIAEFLNVNGQMTLQEYRAYMDKLPRTHLFLLVVFAVLIALLLFVALCRTFGWYIN